MLAEYETNDNTRLLVQSNSLNIPGYLLRRKNENTTPVISAEGREADSELVATDIDESIFNSRVLRSPSLVRSTEDKHLIS